MITCCPKKWLSFFKAACDEQRQKMLEVLRLNKTLNASQIIKKVGLSQPTVAHHLKILCQASLITAKKKGKEVFYSINKDNISNCCSGFMNKFTHKNK